MKRKIISLVLSAAVAFSIIPLNVYAEETDSIEEVTETEEQEEILEEQGDPECVVSGEVDEECQLGEASGGAGVDPVNPDPEPEEPVEIFTYLTGRETVLYSGWYKVPENAHMDYSSLQICGDVRITVPLSGQIKLLSITETSGSHSSLTIDGSGSFWLDEGGIQVTDLTINDGTVYISAGNESEAILADNVTISGGGIKVSSPNVGIGINNSFTMTGGDVEIEAHSGISGYSDRGVFTISGGFIRTTTVAPDKDSCSIENAGDIVISGGAFYTSQEINSFRGNIVLSCTDNYVKINSLLTSTNGTVSVAPGKAVTDGVRAFGGILSEEDIAYIQGKDLTASDAYDVTYFDGNQDQVHRATIIDGTEETLSGGWYVVDHDVSIENLITVNGDLNLILADDCKLEIKVENLVDLEAALDVKGSLTIYGQRKGTGTLAVASNRYGVWVGDNGISGSFTMNGGKVVIGATDCVALGVEDDVIINRGMVTLGSTHSSAIHAYDNVTINGGNVDARTTNGSVAVYAEKSITLGWTEETDSIYASSYYSLKDHQVIIADGKKFITENRSQIFSGSVEYNDIEQITLKPFDGACDLAGYQVNIEGSIGVNFYLLVDEELLVNDDNYLLFTLPGDKEEKLLIGDIDPRTKEVDGVYYHVFPCHISAKEMTSPIKARMYYADGSVASKEFSFTFRDYAMFLINQDDHKALLTDVLNYGAYSQKYFGFKTDELADSELESKKVYTDEDVAAALTELNKSLVLTQYDLRKLQDTGVNLVGSSLVLESETTLKLYFTGDALTDAEAVEESVKAELTESAGGYKVVVIKGIDWTKLATVSYIRLTVDGQQKTISVSPLTYCYLVLSNKDNYRKELVDLCLSVCDLAFTGNE